MEFRCCFFLLSSSFAFVRVGFHCVSGGWHLLCYLFELNAPTEHSIEKDVKIDKYAQRIGWEYIISARFFSFHSRSLLSFPFRGYFFSWISCCLSARKIYPFSFIVDISLVWVAPKSFQKCMSRRCCSLLATRCTDVYKHTRCVYYTWRYRLFENIIYFSQTDRAHASFVVRRFSRMSYINHIVGDENHRNGERERERIASRY